MAARYTETVSKLEQEIERREEERARDFAELQSKSEEALETMRK